MRAYKKLVVAALAGALTMFVWGGFSHLVLLKGVGFSRLPNEPELVLSLRRTVSKDGLYFFPGTDFRKTPTSEEQAAFEARFRAGPTGLIVYRSAGDSPVSGKKLGLQAASHFFAAAIAAHVVSLLAGASFAKRVTVVGLLGAFSTLAVGTIYWNWYGFPNAFLLAQCIDMVVGWTLAGAAIAFVLNERPKPVHSRRTHSSFSSRRRAESP